ncbi:MAG: hypothetical protein HRT83_05195 [Hyphomicrobiaceae bacterium]|nr:hypothetical protein [Hyphomicrobiaceae bacterium]
MRTKSPPHMQVVKRKSKQDQLIDFILKQLDLLDDRDQMNCSHELQLIALSSKSPVVSALMHVAQTRNLSKYSVRIIFASSVETNNVQFFKGLRQVSIHYAKNSRLLEAHEQLVISNATCWIGDCMRRDPGKCDSIECYAENCEETTSRAKTSFERFWLMSIPMIYADTNKCGELVSQTLITMPNCDRKTVIVSGTLH